MTEARDIEAIVAAWETARKIGIGTLSLSGLEAAALIADWQAKKAEIERLTPGIRLTDKSAVNEISDNTYR